MPEPDFESESALILGAADAAAVTSVADELRTMILVLDLDGVEMEVRFANRAFRRFASLPDPPAPVTPSGRELLGETAFEQIRRLAPAALAGTVWRFPLVVESPSVGQRAIRVLMRALAEASPPQLLVTAEPVRGKASNPADDDRGGQRGHRIGAHMEHFIEDMPVMVAVWDLDEDEWRAHYANPAFRELWVKLGGEADEVSESAALRLRPELDAAQMLGRLLSGVYRGSVVEFEREFVEPDGTAHKVGVVGYPLPDSGQVVTVGIDMSVDAVTLVASPAEGVDSAAAQFPAARLALDRVDAERIVAGMPILAVKWRVAGERVYLAWANAAYRAFWGHTPDAELEGREIGQVVLPDTASIARASIVEAVRGGRAGVDRIMEDGCGRVRVVKWLAQRTRDPASNEVMTVGFDLTAAVERTGQPDAAAGAVTIEGFEPDKLLADLPALVSVWEEDGPDAVLLYANEAFRKFIGTDVVVPGMRMSLAHGLADGPAFGEVFAEIRSGGARRWRGSARSADGDIRQLDITSYEVDSPGAFRFVVAAIDLTEPSRAARQVADSGLAERFSLTSRQVEVLRLIAAGASTRDVAEQLEIELDTVKWHVKQILQRTGAANRAQAVAMVLGSDAARRVP